ncbi:DUF6086 family protein [Micromonospora aurantiaca]|uniref:DUF6086 family protein n=1 Tax=Micromonospora aurantiaca (nom. illeg.) TaxID=47850 RepID=UPI003801C459
MSAEVGGVTARAPTVTGIPTSIGDETLWNPANGVADLFVRTAEALAQAEGVSSGIEPLLIRDEYWTNADEFTAFIEGFTATALVSVERAGHDIDALRNPPPSDWRDVSVDTAGLAAPGDAERLRALREASPRAMPY